MNDSCSVDAIIIALVMISSQCASLSADLEDRATSLQWLTLFTAENPYQYLRTCPDDFQMIVIKGKFCMYAFFDNPYELFLMLFSIRNPQFS
jgi:hypothetical protein